MDSYRRRGLLGLAATVVGSAALAWVLAMLVLEAVAVPDLPGVVMVSGLCGFALVAFASVLLPLNASIRLLAYGIAATTLIVVAAPGGPTKLGGAYVAWDVDEA